MKRKHQRVKRGSIWLKTLDLGLLMGFMAPILHHLGLFALPLALGLASVGLALALASAWFSLKTLRCQIKTKDNKELKGGKLPWWS